MANQKKNSFIIVVTAQDKDGKYHTYQRQTRSREKMARFEAEAKHWGESKRGNIICYEMIQIIHLKKVSFRRAKKCDAQA